MKTIWILMLLTLFSSDQKKSAGDFPFGLMIEFIRNPEYVRILDPRPEFSWIVPDNTLKQTAYQILFLQKENFFQGILVISGPDLRLSVQNPWK